jgi:hypothetical protein
MSETLLRVAATDEAHDQNLFTVHDVGLVERTE